jgi:hypothetical protein
MYSEALIYTHLVIKGPVNVVLELWFHEILA